MPTRLPSSPGLFNLALGPVLWSEFLIWRSFAGTHRSERPISVHALYSTFLFRYPCRVAIRSHFYFLNSVMFLLPLPAARYQFRFQSPHPPAAPSVSRYFSPPPKIRRAALNLAAASRFSPAGDFLPRRAGSEPRRERRGPSRVRPGRAARHVRPRQAPTTDFNLSARSIILVGRRFVLVGRRFVLIERKSRQERGRAGDSLLPRGRRAGARGLVVLFAGDLWSFSPKGETHRE